MAFILGLISKLTQILTKLVNVNKHIKTLNKMIKTPEDLLVHQDHMIQPTQENPDLPVIMIHQDRAIQPTQPPNQINLPTHQDNF